jgi:MFS family permease
MNIEAIIQSHDEEPLTSLPFFGQVALICANTLLFVGIFSLGPALPKIEAAFASDPGASHEIQIVGSIAGLTFAVTSLVVGRSVERYGYRRILIWSLLLFSVVGMLGAVFTSMPALIVTRAVVGFASALIVNASLIGIGRISSTSRRARILGVQGLLTSCAAVVLFPLSGVLSGIDWRLPLLLSLVGLIVIPMARTLPQVTTLQTGVETPAKLGRIGFALPFAIILVGSSLFIGTAFGSLYLAKLGIRSAVLLSFPSTCHAIGTVIGSCAYIVLNSRYRINGIFIVALGAVAAGLTLAGSSTGVLMYTVGSLCVGFGVGIFIPNLNAAAIAASPSNPSRTLGVVNGLFFGSVIVFPLVVAPLANTNIGPGEVIHGFGLMALIAIFMFILRSKKSSSRAV